MCKLIGESYRVAEMADLRSFLGRSPSSLKCQLFLPHFRGTAVLDTNGIAAPPLSYRGSTFTERDSRAAFYVQSLLSQIVDPDDIEIQPAVPHQAITATAFLFGSKSNQVTQSVLQGPNQRLFWFEFGKEWKIHCSGLEFSIPDPSTLSPATYDDLDDYGTVARFASATGSVFIIGGLGGRATEGCGYFLLKNWVDLLKRFGHRDFAVVLKFPHPFALANWEFVATAHA